MLNFRIQFYHWNKNVVGSSIDVPHYINFLQESWTISRYQYPLDLLKISDLSTLLYELILCVVRWHVTCRNTLFLNFSPQLKPCKDLFLPYLCGTYLWFLSNPIKFILPVVEEWSFGLCKIMSSSKLAGIGKVGLRVQAEYTFPVSSSILCCLLNFNFKWKLRILIQSHYFVAEWLKHSMSASLGVCF